VRIESKLWDLLGDEPIILHDPTLNDLIGAIQHVRKRGEVPFNEEPFRALVELPVLKTGALFREIINRAHHGRADQITPAEAEVVREHYEAVLSTIEACWRSYARHMRRLSPDPLTTGIEQGSRPAPPRIVTFPQAAIPMIGRLAAHQGGSPLVTAESASASFRLNDLGEVSFFTIRAATLGLVALPGQTVIVSISEEVRSGDLAIAQVGSKIFARRIGRDKSDAARLSLESIPSISTNVPPTHFVPAATTRLLKIIGVLFDDRATPGTTGEAVATESSPILRQVVASAQVAGDSAFPLARDGYHVLVGAPGPLRALVGRIVAVITRQSLFSQEYNAFLKRLGRPMPNQPDVFYLENVGEMGEGEYVQVATNGSAPAEGIPIVDTIWKVHGVVFR
jgi:hypothetical protein